MIKSHLEQVTKPERIVDDIICEVCGKPIKRNRDGSLKDYLPIHKKWDATSDHDNDEQDIDICEDCWYKILGTFKIPVPIKIYDAYGDNGDYAETIAHKNEFNTDVHLNNGWLHK